MCKNPLRVKRKYPASSLCCNNVPLSERAYPCRAVQVSKMLLPNYVYSSSLYTIDLFAIGSLQGPEDSNITGLELVGGMRGQPTKYNVVLETKLQDLKGLLSSEAILDKHPWFHISPLPGL
jgi:hypothetical protein